MKLKLLISTFILLMLAGITGLLALRYHINREKPVDETRKVYVKKTESGYQLYRNGEPFYIQGAGGESWFKELAEIGGNTIRFYDTLNLENKLNEAQKYNLAVIVDIPIPPSNNDYDFYLNEKNRKILKKKIKALINKHKNHPALLMWNLGNEIKYPFVPKKNIFIKTFNELIEMIHKEDPDHPVSTSIAGVSRKAMASIYVHSPGIDLLAFNTFGGTKSTNLHFTQISYFFGDRPYYFSELSSDGPWEARYTSWGAPIEPTSVKKSEHIKTRYNIIKENNDQTCIGHLIFYWGNKLERTFTWFSLFLNDHKSESIKEIENLWKGSNTCSNSIGLDYMLVDEKGAYDNLVFSPSEFKTAEIFFIDSIHEPFNIEWEILPEVWIEDTSKMIQNPKKPLDLFVDFDNCKASFFTPGQEGAYRIFAHVFDQYGFFATTNTPFYVLNKNGKK